MKSLRDAESFIINGTLHADPASPSAINYLKLNASPWVGRIQGCVCLCFAIGFIIPAAEREGVLWSVRSPFS